MFRRVSIFVWILSRPEKKTIVYTETTPMKPLSTESPLELLASHCDFPESFGRRSNSEVIPVYQDGHTKQRKTL